MRSGRSRSDSSIAIETGGMTSKTEAQAFVYSHTNDSGAIMFKTAEPGFDSREVVDIDIYALEGLQPFSLFQSNFLVKLKFCCQVIH
jgi:hypothetical protein